MEIQALVRTIRNRLLSLTDKLSFLAPLLIRITVGLVFIGTGWGKLHSLDKVTEYFDSLGIPMPGLNARVAASTEFFGGILILFGLGSRLVALPLAFTMVVAILTARRNDVHGITDLVGLDPEWSYLVMFLVVAIAGPGALSLDALIARRFPRGDNPAKAPPALRPTEAVSNT